MLELPGFIEILAKPTRNRDICVSEVRNPKGRGGVQTIITQGKIIKPTAFVWNLGRKDESLSVTYKIGSSYTDTKWIKLYPYNDTLLEFSPWTATPGSYTATCYSNLTGDEFVGNDTATLNFRVVADTWVSMFPVYNQGVNTGACITPVGDNELYCVTGSANFFTKYLIDQNLWKNRRPTPANFHHGGSITNANNNYLYALRGNLTKSFYRYSISTNTWSTTLANTPEKIGGGGALAYGGNNCIYAFRGCNKKSFYRYNILNNTWQTLAETPDKVDEGASLCWTGGDFLFALRGDNKTDFYRYQISSNQWSRMASIPQAVRLGGSLAYYPLTNKIYAFCGNTTNWFYVYNIANNTWSQRRQTPYPVKTGGCLAYNHYSIYGIMGRGYNQDFWRYSPAVGGESEEEGKEPIPSNSKYQNPGGLILGGEELLTYDPTDKYNPQFSPDGKWIVYTAEDSLNESFSLYKIKSSGGDIANLTNDTITYENPRWSSDGSWLIASGEEGLYKIASDGSRKELIVQGIIGNPRWSVNDDWIIYEKWDNELETHNIYKVRSDGTEETCLLQNTDEYLQPQPISENEPVCIKLKGTPYGDVYQIYKITDGNESQLTSDYSDNINPHLSPDGQWITYEKLDETGYWQIYKIRTDGQEETKLTNNESHHTTPVFSPDGNWIAYAKWPVDSTGAYEYSQICYIPAAGGPETPLNDPDAIRENPSWSPDCAWITYQKTTDYGSTEGGKKRKYKQLAKVPTRLKLQEALSELGVLPKIFVLYQNRPNPFRNTTTIRYGIPTGCNVKLDIFDITGRVVKKLVAEKQKPNYYTVKWDGRDNRGKKVSSGTYFYILKADGKVMKKRMLLIR